jgi:hypothetical protein
MMSKEAMDMFKRIGVVNHEIHQMAKQHLIDTNDISDGYHTFGELYEHRCRLWITLCRVIEENVWRSKKHSDGTQMMGWFILGIYHGKGNQMTYHLPESMWNDCEFAEELKEAPEYDGHTSADVLERIGRL